MRSYSAAGGMRMRGTIVLAFSALAVALVLLSGSARAQDVVLVLSSDKPQHHAVAAGFREAFPGAFEEINLRDSDEEQRETGKRLNALGPKVVITVGDLAAQMAKLYLGGIPVVYCDSVNAAEITLTTGNNMGVYHEPDPGVQLEVIHQLFPDKTNVAVLFSSEYAKIDQPALDLEAGRLGVRLEIAPIGNIKQVPDRVQQILPHSDLLWIFSDPAVLSSHSIQYILIQSLAAGVPVFGGSASLARGGAAAGWVTDYRDAGRQAAAEAKRIMGGTIPQPGSVCYPAGMLIVNNKVAGVLSVSFPPEAVSRAAEVIK